VATPQGREADKDSKKNQAGDLNMAKQAKNNLNGGIAS
jgi:hypothetical protein